MKKATIVLDDKLVSQGLKLTGLKTQKDLIHLALLQLVRRESQLGLLKLRGNIEWEGDLNEMRKGRNLMRVLVDLPCGLISLEIPKLQKRRNG